MTSMEPDLTYPADIVTKPERAIADYLVSRRLQSEIVKKLPDWDIACDSPDANLVLAKRELAEAKCVLNSEKVIYDAKTKEINEKWNDLTSKQYELRDTFEKNDKVLKTNYKERKKSEKQISEEELEQKRIQSDINDLVKQLQYYQTTEAKLTESIEELRMYEDFLQKVVAEYPEFNCIDDILNRYESLIDTREEMRDLQIKSINQVEKIRQEVEEFTEERLLDLYNLNQSLSQLRLKKYFVQSELTHWVQAIEKLRDMGIKDYIEITKAVEGIWLLYLNMCAARKENPELEKTQLREQLKYIIDNTILLSGVIEESKKFLKKPRQKGTSLPSEREIDQWSIDYEMFQSINSNRAQCSKND